MFYLFVPLCCVSLQLKFFSPIFNFLPFIIFFLYITCFVVIFSYFSLFLHSFYISLPLSSHSIFSYVLNHSVGLTLCIFYFHSLFLYSPPLYSSQCHCFIPLYSLVPLHYSSPILLSTLLSMSNLNPLHYGSSATTLGSCFAFTTVASGSSNTTDGSVTASSTTVSASASTTVGFGSASTTRSSGPPKVNEMRNPSTVELYK